MNRHDREVASPDHWAWRLEVAREIASQLDPCRFGVTAMYVIGSAKHATAGPDSDLDLLVHFHGTEQQREQLVLWFEGWSLGLDEANHIRTGRRSGGLLDIHFVTDIDVAAKSSYAVKIGSPTDPALPLPLKRVTPAGETNIDQPPPGPQDRNE